MLCKATLVLSPPPTRTTQNCWWQNNLARSPRAPASRDTEGNESLPLMAATWQFSDGFPGADYRSLRFTLLPTYRPSLLELTPGAPSTHHQAWDPCSQIRWLLRQGIRSATKPCTHPAPQTSLLPSGNLDCYLFVSIISSFSIYCGPSTLLCSGIQRWTDTWTPALVERAFWPERGS